MRPLTWAEDATKKQEKLGKDRVYIDYIKKLAQFLLDNGRLPMFWGDIILGFPEMIKEPPKEIICLKLGLYVEPAGRRD